MNGNITNYFHRYISDHFEAQSISTHHRGRRKILGPKENSVLDELMPFGIADAAKENKKYQSLLKTYGIHLRSNVDLIRSAPKREVYDRHNIKVQRCRESRRQSEQKIENSTLMRFLQLRLEKKWSMKSIWWRLGLQQTQISELLRSI